MLLHLLQELLLDLMRVLLLGSNSTLMHLLHLRYRQLLLLQLLMANRLVVVPPLMLLLQR